MVSRKINKLIAIVVWYNPKDKEREAVLRYHNDVERVIIVDNSDADNTSLCATITNADYLPLLGNRGIAYALNRGCERAMEMGADWVLTMDQDSRWDTNTVAQFIDEAEQYEDFNQVAVFSPYHDAGPLARPGNRSERFAEWKMVMTSGNLLRISAWKQVGGFRDDFFIDCVDDEIDCHLIQQGWKIIRCNAIALNHFLGEGAHHLPGTHYSYTPHPAWRYYYIGRNLQRIAQLYPERRSYYHHRAHKELKRLLLYDWDDKWNKLKAYLRGWKEGALPYPTPFRMVVAPQSEQWREWMQTIPVRFFVEGKVIYDARNQIRVFSLPDGSLVNVKRFHAPRGLNRCVYSLMRQPKAQRAYLNAIRLCQAGISTPEPMGYILCGRKWLNESYLITRQSPLANRFYEFRFHSIQGYEDVLTAFAQLTAKMHQQGILHLDYSPGNILWDRDNSGQVELAIVDINRLAFDQHLSQRTCCKNFRRLWGHRDFMDYLCAAYAKAMGWNKDRTQVLIEKYWKRFWHIHTEADIEEVFSYIVKPKK